LIREDLHVLLMKVGFVQQRSVNYNHILCYLRSQSQCEFEKTAKRLGE
jgi:hypothetical protein